MDAANTLLLWAIPAILAITLHEAAHGYAARHFGDFTAARAGRISLNPIRHIDPVGTLLVPAVLYFTAGMMFGWAKPVPVDFRQLRNPKADMLWVAAAGPAANLLMAIGWTVLFALGVNADNPALFAMASAGIQINLILCVFNLFPLPPLDGGRIAVSLLPRNLAYRFAQIEPYGMIIIVLLLLSGLIWPLLRPFLNLLAGGLTGLADALIH